MVKVIATANQKGGVAKTTTMPNPGGGHGGRRQEGAAH